MKHTRYVSKRLQQSAKGQQCQMNVASCCSYDRETVVLAHVNTEGGHVGMKEDDFSAVFACSKCHEWLDQHRGNTEDELFYTRRALMRTLRIWFDEKVVRV